MAVMTRARRRFADDSTTALERSRMEDARLMQRINGAAAALHSLWSADWPADLEQLASRRARLAALQAEIDGLYEQRRQLVAERALQRDTSAEGWRTPRWSNRLAA